MTSAKFEEKFLEVRLPEVASTIDFGRRIGGIVRVGDVILLAGKLGAGKTVLVRGIADGMGVTGRVSSPTFVLSRVHPAGRDGGIRLVHVDAYRLGTDIAQLDDIDLDSELTNSAVVIEWGEGIAQRLAADYLLIRLDRQDDDTRIARIYPIGEWRTRVEELR